MLKSLLSQLLARGRPAARTASGPAGKGEIEEAVSRSILKLGLGLAPGQPADYDRIARIVAGVEAAQYMVDRMQAAINLPDRNAVLDHGLANAKLDGLMLEFGVYRGASLRFIAQRTPGLVHGFDSFQGLPEDWTHFQRQGRFSLNEPPTFNEPNIRIHQGLFRDTLPSFLAQNEGNIRFLHIDCDLYSSTREVLELVAGRLAPGTIVVFDEYINFPGWRQHEYRAFQEFVARHEATYSYVAFASSYMSVALRIERI
jgi:hypothetical protein